MCRHVLKKLDSSSKFITYYADGSRTTLRCAYEVVAPRLKIRKRPEYP